MTISFANGILLKGFIIRIVAIKLNIVIEKNSFNVLYRSNK